LFALSRFGKIEFAKVWKSWEIGKGEGEINTFIKVNWIFVTSLFRISGNIATNP